MLVISSTSPLDAAAERVATSGMILNVTFCAAGAPPPVVGVCLEGHPLADDELGQPVRPGGERLEPIFRRTDLLVVLGVDNLRARCRETTF